MRDIDKNPYSPDEARVAKFFADRGVGGGDDPIGSILASHDYLAAQRKEARDLLARIRQWDHLDGAGDGPFWKREIDAALSHG